MKFYNRDEFHYAKETLLGLVGQISFSNPSASPLFKGLLTEHAHQSDTPSLFDSHAITGGSPEYLEMQAVNRPLTHDKMLDFILEPILG